MQSGYGTGGGGGGGGVSEIQQFMVEGCPSSASTSMFSMSTSNANLHPLQPPPHHFPHFHSIPITQQLFHQAHHFQLFSHQHHQELGLDLESGPENSTSPNRIIIGSATGAGSGGGGPPPSFLTAAMSFKLGVNDNSAGTREGLNDDEPLQLHRDDHGSDSHVHHPWQQREEESTIKEPFWRPLDIDYINRNNKRTNEKQQLQESSSKYSKKVSKEGSAGEHQEQQQDNNNGTNYKLFSELEAIYKPGNSVHGGGGDAGGSSSANNQTGSGSALTGDENPLMTLVAPGPIGGKQHLSTINQGSDTSTGEEAPVMKHAKSRRRRKRRQQLSSVAAFFENLVKQLMDHQEGLHRRFLEVVEKRDQERVIREEAWRKEEAAKSSREAASRAQERVIVSTRETAIISFLEKITGETLNLPTKAQFQSQQAQGDSQKDDNTEPSYDPLDLSQEFLNSNNNNNSSSIGDMNNNRIQMNTSRWPKAEVQALIKVRSSLETRFQEPGLKGPLWEEVSSMMASMGYCRSSKRCKEKWENINKYFRKTKESGKKRPMHSKTCPYFHQLDQLYSKTVNKLLPPPPTTEERKDHNSELLDAIVLPSEHSSFKMNLGEEGDEGTDHEHGEKEEEEGNGKHHQNHENEHLFQPLES